MKKISMGILILSLMVTPQSYLFAQTGVSIAPEPIEKLSLDIKGMDILDVFRLLSMRGNLNIIAGKNVTGKVTLFLKDVDTWEAFEIIIAANGLAFEKRNNIIYVMTERDYELIYGKKYEDRRIVKSIKLQYATAEDVSKAVSQFKTNIGRVVADNTSDTIVLMDIPGAIAEMEKIIKGLDIPLETKVYSLQYAKVDEMKERLNEMLTDNVGNLRIDERTNKVIVTDLAERIPLFDQVIAVFDEKHKEVIIEAKILQITLNDDYKTGINWDAVFIKMNHTLHNIATFGVSLKYSDQASIIPTTTATGAGGALQIGNLSSEGYQAVIQALKEYGETKLLSSPRIAVINNEEASILVGTNQPYATRTISQGSAGTGNIEAENVTFIDLGIKLIVTPTINDDNFVTMKIKPEVSSKLGDFTIESSQNTIPIVKTTTTETTVMVKSGATVLIGGLIEENIRESVREVPGLADIPLIGNLFRSRTIGSGDNTNPEKTELVIFLTPHIISGEESTDLFTVDKIAQDITVDRFFGEMNKSKEITTENMTPGEYYNLIVSMINEEVEKRKPNIPIYGEVSISFEIDCYGRLLSTPKIYKGRDQSLFELGARSITEAAPFPRFPKSINKYKETLQIAISYE
jgi:type II secretory pathway component GspD/PulD (secretin)